MAGEITICDWCILHVRVPFIRVNPCIGLLAQHLGNQTRSIWLERLVPKTAYVNRGPTGPAPLDGGDWWHAPERFFHFPGIPF